MTPYTGLSLRGFRELGDISEPVGNEIISDDFRIGIGNTVTFCGEDFVVNGKMSLSPSYISSEALSDQAKKKANRQADHGHLP